MSVPILLSKEHLCQAVGEFKQRYPKTAETYRAQIGTARRIVRVGDVQPADGLGGYLVGTLSHKNALLVKDKRCACGEAVCCHRIAVCIAKIGEQIHIAANEAALEANEVHAELAESAESAESEAGE